jgi:hypothetical protein
MKKVLWFVLFILVAFAGDRIGGYLLGKKLESSQFRYSRLFTNRAAADILLIGNSRGLTLYQPSIEEFTGKSTFNLSYNGAPAYLLEALTLDYLEMYPAPKTAIVEITLADRSQKSLLAGFSAYLPYSKHLGKLIQDSLPSEYGAAQVTHLYRYNSEVFHRTLFYANQSDLTWLNEHTLSEDAAKKADDAPHDIQINLSLIESLARTVKALQAKGTKVQLIIAPYVPGFAGVITNLQELKQQVSEKTGLPIHDYSAFLTDYRDFSDYQHPNKGGSVKYLKQMQQDGVF